MGRERDQDYFSSFFSLWKMDGRSTPLDRSIEDFERCRDEGWMKDGRRKACMYEVLEGRYFESVYRSRKLNNYA